MTAENANENWEENDYDQPKARKAETLTKQKICQGQQQNVIFTNSTWWLKKTNEQRQAESNKERETRAKKK